MFIMFSMVSAHPVKFIVEKDGSCSFQVGKFPSLDGNFSISFPSLDGRGLRGGCDKQFIRTAPKTPCVLVNTSLFQNLTTLNP